LYDKYLLSSVYLNTLFIKFTATMVEHSVRALPVAQKTMTDLLPYK